MIHHAMHLVSPRVRSWKLPTSALLAVALAGCASAPLPKLAVPLPSHWRNQPINSATGPSADLTSWWEQFEDAHLNTLVAQALKANLDIGQAVQHLQAAHVLATHSNAPFKPSVGFRTYHPVDPNANASFFVIGFDSLWDLGLFGRRQASQREALAQLRAAGADLRLARANVVAEVVRNWIRLRAAQKRIAILQHIVTEQQQIVHLQKVRVDLQLAATNQLLQARAAAATAAAALAGPRAMGNASAQQLALLLGRSEPATAWLQPQALPRLRRSRLSVVPAALLDSRPQIALARAKVLQAAGELGIAHANRFPDIGLGGSIIWSTSTVAHHGEPSNAIISLGPTIEMPLFDWGLRKARAEAKGHALQASVMAYKQAVLAGVAAVETALGNLAQQRERERSCMDAWRALASAAGAQQTRYALGLSSHLAVAQSNIARDQAQLEVINARQARDIAYAALYEALGGAPHLEAADAKEGPAATGHAS